MWIPKRNVKEFPTEKKTSADTLLEQAWMEKNKKDPNRHIVAALKYELSVAPRHWGVAMVSLGSVASTTCLLLSLFGVKGVLPVLLVELFVLLSGVIILLAYSEWANDGHRRSHEVVSKYLEHEWLLLKQLRRDQGGMLAPVTRIPLKERMKSLLVNRALAIRRYQEDNSHVPDEMMDGADYLMENFKLMYDALKNFGFVGDEGYEPYFAQAAKLQRPLVIV